MLLVSFVCSMLALVSERKGVCDGGPLRQEQDRLLHRGQEEAVLSQGQPGSIRKSPLFFGKFSPCFRHGMTTEFSGCIFLLGPEYFPGRSRRHRSLKSYAMVPHFEGSTFIFVHLIDWLIVWRLSESCMVVFFTAFHYHRASICLHRIRCVVFSCFDWILNQSLQHHISTCHLSVKFNCSQKIRAAFSNGKSNAKRQLQAKKTDQSRPDPWTGRVLSKTSQTATGEERNASL